MWRRVRDRLRPPPMFSMAFDPADRFLFSSANAAHCEVLAQDIRIIGPVGQENVTAAERAEHVLRAIAELAVSFKKTSSNRDAPNARSLTNPGPRTVEAPGGSATPRSGCSAPGAPVRRSCRRIFSRSHRAGSIITDNLNPASRSRCEKTSSIKGRWTTATSRVSFIVGSELSGAFAGKVSGRRRRRAARDVLSVSDASC